ncbi:DUF4336 domain-containing protein [Roseovarius sp. 2305UL8-3]|uniref:DUF4336 domain-containing protein n=1 Tax=Roseovarius conchicola TaxID=3121636 RepID=UPI003528C5E4
MTGYEPLNTLKPVAEGLWLIDGPAIKVAGFPFSTRATVVRLESGDLWVHSPTQLTEILHAELDALGPVRHLIAPNQFHYTHLNDWQATFPEAQFWAAPGVVERAAKHGLTLPQDQPLQADQAERPWAEQIDQLLVRGSKWHNEVVFFHRPSSTLILTDILQAFETAKLPAHCRPWVWLNGIEDVDGRMPPIIRRSYRDKNALGEDIEQMIDWGPRRVIIAHGKWYERNGVAELERAFRKLLRDRQWTRAFDEMEKQQGR